MLVAEWATLREDADARAPASSRDSEASDAKRDLAAPSFILSDPFGGLAIVCGHPAPALISQMPPAVGEVIAYPENIDAVRAALPDWFADPVHVHVLGDGDNAGEAGRAPAVALIEPQRAVDLPGVPVELRDELLEAVDDDLLLAAAFDGARAVAFCYAASQSGRYWDVSIDTLETHRRRGYAQAAAAFMIRHMREAFGLEPVWCSAHSNPGSTRLAERLGFHLRLDEASEARIRSPPTGIFVYSGQVF